ncbi:hypothetical protein AWP58_23760, partial [Escherichia coli]
FSYCRQRRLCSCRMRRERLIRHENPSNPIDCSERVGLISVAHQAMLRLSSVSNGAVKGVIFIL